MILHYLACPYNHADPAVKQQRYQLATAAAAHLMTQGTMIFSPLTHNVPLIQSGAPTGWTFWSPYDLAMLEKCQKLLVLTIDGWQTSLGVKHEIDLATSLGIPIEYIELPLHLKPKKDAAHALT